MKRYFGILYVLAICLAGSDVLAAGLQNAPEFSADVVMQTQGRVMQSKMFISHEKIRTETMGQIMIIRKDLNVMWMVMPQGNMYMEQPIDPNALTRTSQTMPGETERVPMGKEVIDGKPADKFKITYNAGRGPTTVFQWIGEKQVPVKMQSEDGQWEVDYKNIQFGPQDASLFEVPEGSQKMQIPAMGNQTDGQ